MAAVLLYHGGFAWARGGFLGVDAFFVLSGFLITSLLLDEATRTGAIALGRFWGRRARRLLPALIAVVIGVAGYAWLFAAPDALVGIRKDAIATLGYVANWRFIFAKASYFQKTAPPSPLRHTWSLAIEEQFYLIWPLLVLAVARGDRPWRRVGAAAAVAASASVAAMVLLYHPGHDPSRVYYGSDTRANVILIGAALAAVATARTSSGGRRRPAHRARRSRPSLLAPALGAAALAGAAAWGWAVVRVDGTAGWLYRGGFPLLALAVAAVIAHAVMIPNGLTARILGLGPLRWLGRISYGVYLWHWPLFLAITHARTGLGGWALFGARASATLALSAASFWFLELPIRRGRFVRWRAGGLLTATAALAAAAVILATAVPAGPPATALAATTGGADAPSSTSVHWQIRRPARAPGQPARVLVVGDSVGETLTPGLVPYARQSGLTFDNQGTLGCGLVRGGPYRYFGQVGAQPSQCEQWPQRWARNVARDDPDLVMVVIGRWEVMDRVHNGRWTHPGDPEFDSYLESEIDHAITVLSANRARVVFLSAPYYLRGERPDGGRWPEDDPGRVDQFNQLLREAVGRRSDVASVIEFGAHTSIGGRYTPVIDGVHLRYDGVHFTVQGARWLAPWLLPQLAELVPPVNDALPAVTPTTVFAFTTTTGRSYAYRTTTTIYRMSTTTQRLPSTTATTAPSTSTSHPTTTVVQIITRRTVPTTTTTVAVRH